MFISSDSTMSRSGTKPMPRTPSKKLYSSRRTMLLPPFTWPGYIYPLMGLGRRQMRMDLFPLTLISLQECLLTLHEETDGTCRKLGTSWLRHMAYRAVRKGNGSALVSLWGYRKLVEFGTLGLPLVGASKSTYLLDIYLK